MTKDHILTIINKYSEFIDGFEAVTQIYYEDIAEDIIKLSSQNTPPDQPQS